MENKTGQTAIDPADFIAAVPDATRRADALTLAALMAQVSGEPPAMWGPSIVGFGRYRYRYDSGREGDMCRIGFSPRKAASVLYLACDLDRHQPLLDRLGKHTRSGGCLYLKRLDDVDGEALEALIATAWAER